MNKALKEAIFRKETSLIQEKMLNFTSRWEKCKFKGTSCTSVFNKDSDVGHLQVSAGLLSNASHTLPLGL